MGKTNIENTNEKSYLKEVKSELKKVKWPTKKDIIKYTISTLVIVVFFAIYFVGIESLFAFIKGFIK